MTHFEMAIRHVAEGTAYSWDLTVLLGLGIALSAHMRERLLRGRTGAEDAAYVTALYTRKLLGRRGD